jgi:hypothetical protein
MKKHFCTCPETKYPNQPCNHNKGCDPCIQKNLKFGEIPSCFWSKITGGVVGKTENSVEEFIKFYLNHKAQVKKKQGSNFL